MVRMTAIVWMLSVCMPETLLAGVAFEAGEIDSSAVKAGSYVEIIYGRGEWDPVSGEWQRLDTAKGYIQAVDAERLIIGEQFWKKEIALERVQKLTILEVARKIKRSVLETAQTPIQRFDQKAVAIMARGAIETAKIAMGKSLTNDDFRYCDGVCFPRRVRTFLLGLHLYCLSIGVLACRLRCERIYTSQSRTHPSRLLSREYHWLLDRF